MWKNKKIGSKTPTQKKFYNTKKRKAEKTKKEYLFIGVMLLIGVSIILGFSAVDEDEIKAVLRAKAQRGIEYQVKSKNATEGENLLKKVILEPSVEQVKAEIVRQANKFDLDPDKMLLLCECESQFDYKAKNPNSTARGTFQYLIRTWEQTESAKKGIERNDYKANIREAMIDISNGESWRWKQCLDKYNLVF